MNHFITKHTHNIKTAGGILPISIAQTIEISGLSDSPPFPCIHRLQGMTASCRRPVFYLDKHQIPSLSGNQVYFSKAAAEIFLDNPKPLCLQIFRRPFFILRPLAAVAVCAFRQSIPPVFPYYVILPLPHHFILDFNFSISSTNTRISATTSYNSGGIISPISSLDNVFASLSSR